MGKKKKLDSLSEMIWGTVVVVLRLGLELRCVILLLLLLIGSRSSVEVRSSRSDRE